MYCMLYLQSFYLHNCLYHSCRQSTQTCNCRYRYWSCCCRYHHANKDWMSKDPLREELSETESLTEGL